MRADIGELGDHVLANQRVGSFVLVRMRLGVYDGLGAIRVAQPVRYGRQVIEVLAAGDGRHRTAIRMTANHDVAYLENRHRVFDGRRNAARLGAVGGHDVARIADDEQVAQLANIRTHPSVAVALAQHRLNLHGWIYDIENGVIDALDGATGDFVPLADNPQVVAT